MSSPSAPGSAATPSGPSNYSPGLAGVTAGISAISEVDAEHNRLVYRGYDVHDLVAHCTFDEVAFLLLRGKLPDAAELKQFTAEVGANREVPQAIYDLLAALPPGGHPMDTLKAAVAALALHDPDRDSDSPEANQRKSLRLFAKMPTLVANGYRIARGSKPAKPNPAHTHGQNFLSLLDGAFTPGPPTGEFPSDVLDVTQILYAEHGFNASTFCARVTVSTLSDVYSGVVSAIGTLKGPLHGGANEAAMEMLLQIGSVENAQGWIENALERKAKIMGFGHREYKHGDERAKIVKGYAVELGRRLGNTKWHEISEIVERVMLERKHLHPNLDFPVATAYYLMNIPIELYTPIFVMSRVTGWCAHMIEQLANNRIIRPHSEYNGPKGLKVPMGAGRRERMS